MSVCKRIGTPPQVLIFLLLHNISATVAFAWCSLSGKVEHDDACTLFGGRRAHEANDLGSRLARFALVDDAPTPSRIEEPRVKPCCSSMFINGRTQCLCNVHDSMSSTRDVSLVSSISLSVS